MSTTITIIVENYIKELRIRKYAASTVETYSRVCRRLLGWCSVRMSQSLRKTQTTKDRNVAKKQQG